MGRGNGCWRAPGVLIQNERENVGTYNGTAKDDRLIGDSDVIEQVVNKMYGNGGNDVLTGGTFATNYLYGGDGNDALTAGDGNSGMDWNFNEYQNVDRLYGDAGADTLSAGFSENARLYGGSGADILYASGSSTYLDGGSGADTLYGGDSGDTFVVDNKKDVISETFTPAYDNQYNPPDLVMSSVSWTLGVNLENLTLTGSKDLSGLGNAEDNLITGNKGNNALGGMAGADQLLGGKGDDTLDGGSGADTLTGGAGEDHLTGGTGKDRFVFSSGDSGSSKSTADTITDFSHKSGDKIDLHLIDAKAGGSDDAFTWIGSKAFDGKAGELHYSFSGGNTYLSGDVNGDGHADFVIKLDGHIDLVKGDFVL